MNDSRPPFGILLVTWNFPPKRGGIERLVFHLAKGLQQNHLLFIIAGHGARAGGLNAMFYPAPLGGLFFFGFYAFFRGLWVLLTHKEIRIIYGGSTLTAPVVCFMARLTRRHAVVNVYGSDVTYSSFVYQWLCVRWLRSCDRVIAISRYTADLASSQGVPERNLRVVPPSIEWERFVSGGSPEAKRQLGLEGKRVVLFVGRLTRRKGVKEFLEHCWPLIHKQVTEAFLLIVGDDPKDSLIHRERLSEELVSTVRRLGQDSNVRFVKSLADEELIHAYSACDLLVLPVLPADHDVEGFGIVIIEAAAAGKPAVATRVGGIVDAVHDGRSGLLVDPLDFEGMARAVAGLLRDEPRRSAMGEFAQGRAREQFGRETVLRRYEEILLEL